MNLFKNNFLQSLKNWEDDLKTVDLFVKEALHIFLQRSIEVIPFAVVAKHFLETTASLSVPSDRPGTYWTIGDVLKVWFIEEEITLKLWDHLSDMGLNPLDDDQVFVAIIKAYFLQKLFIEHERWFSEAFQRERYQLPKTLWRWLHEAGLEVHENDPFFWTGAVDRVDVEIGYEFEDYRDLLDTIQEKLFRLDSLLIRVEKVLEEMSEHAFRLVEPDHLRRSLLDPSSLADLVDGMCREDSLPPLVIYSKLMPEESSPFFSLDDLKQDLEIVHKAFKNRNLLPEIKLKTDEDGLTLLIFIENTSFDSDRIILQ